MNNQIKRPLQPVVKETIVERSLYNIQASLEKGLRMGYTLEEMLSAFTDVGRACVTKMIIEYEFDNHHDYAKYKGITQSRVPQILQRVNREINKFFKVRLSKDFEPLLYPMHYVTDESMLSPFSRPYWKSTSVSMQMRDIVAEWMPISNEDLLKLADIATSISEQLSE